MHPTISSEFLPLHVSLITIDRNYIFPNLIVVVNTLVPNKKLTQLRKVRDTYVRNDNQDRVEKLNKGIEDLLAVETLARNGA